MTTVRKLDERMPPYDLEAEKAVCGSLLIDGDCITDVLNIITTKHFFTAQNKVVFDAAYRIYCRGEGINQVTVARELASIKTQNGKEESDKLSDIGGASYLMHLIAEVPTSLHAEYYANIVKRLAILRECISFSAQITKKAYDEITPTELIKYINTQALEIQSELAMPHLLTPEQITTMGIQRYGDMVGKSADSLKTGFYDLDIATGGMFPGEYWVLGARPSVGKTTLALQIARHILMQNDKHRALFVSLEQKWSDILDRRVAAKIQQPIRIVRSGNYTDEFFGSINSAMGEIAKERIYFYDSGDSTDIEEATCQSIYSIANTMKMSHGLSVMFIDYLGLIEDYHGNNDEQRVSFISRSIKKMARTLNIPIFVVCQLSRRLETQTDRKPKLNDLRSSGSIEQDADVVTFLYRDDYYQELRQKDNIGKAQWLLAKQRQGGCSEESHVDLLWDFKKQEYLNVARDDEMPEQFR